VLPPLHQQQSQHANRDLEPRSPRHGCAPVKIAVSVLSAS
jgi:hypothetical protein